MSCCWRCVWDRWPALIDVYVAKAPVQTDAGSLTPSLSGMCTVIMTTAGGIFGSESSVVLSITLMDWLELQAWSGQAHCQHQSLEARNHATSAYDLARRRLKSCQIPYSVSRVMNSVMSCELQFNGQGSHNATTPLASS